MNLNVIDNYFKLQFYTFTCMLIFNLSIYQFMSINV